MRELHDYLKAAADYLGTTTDDPHAQAAAKTAQAIADLAAFDYLRDLRSRTGQEPRPQRTQRVFPKYWWSTRSPGRVRKR